MFKVFQICDCDWVAARSKEEAIEWYLKKTGLDKEEIYEEPEECSLDNTMYDYYEGDDYDFIYQKCKANGGTIEYNGRKFIAYDGLQVLTTFREVLEKKHPKSPFIIATEYY